MLPCFDEKTNKASDLFNSLSIYRDQNGHCTRVSDQFYNDHNYLIPGENSFKYVSEGDTCYNDLKYTITYLFQNAENADKGEVKYDTIPTPHHEMQDGCKLTLNIYINFDHIKDELLIQKFYSDYYIFTGIVFFITGIYLLIFAKYKKITKFVICIIYGEIFTFVIGVGLVGIHYKLMEWAFFISGLGIGGFLGYFCLGGNKLYRVILSLTAGFIFGLIIFDILFTHLCSRLSQVLLFDTLLIFMALFALVIQLQHSLHYFYDSIIGGYLFMRGFCLLIQKAGKFARYRELNILLYLLNRYEVELAKYYYKEKWPIYYVYTILMILIMAGSIVYYFFKLYKRDEEDEIEKEEKNQRELIKEKSTAIEDDQALD